MRYSRAAFYLDFDNVFGGLFKLDPDVAIQFASNPGVWLQRLSTTLTVDAPRRWLVLRCYLNPAGWVDYHPPLGEPSRLQFFRFRSSFISAGFEVIDCPRYNATKNGADIRIAVDVVDALSADVTYDEFVIASGDSDMTPLLQRLRRADRRTVVMSSVDAAEAFISIADRTINGQQLLELVQGEPVGVEDDEYDAVAAELDGIGGDHTYAGAVPSDHARAYEYFRSVVADKYNNASEPLNMANLAAQLRSELGPVIDETGWFGFGGFARAVESLKLPNLRMSKHEIWDESRHSPPADAAATVPRVTLPEPVERLTALINLPRLPQGWWPMIYQTLADYASSHQFNLTQCTSWTRDRLREQGFAINRNSVSFVVRGAAFGGCPLYRQPPPTAAEIGEAFVNNVLTRVDGEILTEEEIEMVRTWLGGYS